MTIIAFENNNLILKDISTFQIDSQDGAVVIKFDSGFVFLGKEERKEEVVSPSTSAVVFNSEKYTPVAPILDSLQKRLEEEQKPVLLPALSSPVPSTPPHPAAPSPVCPYPISPNRDYSTIEEVKVRILDYIKNKGGETTFRYSITNGLGEETRKEQEEIMSFLKSRKRIKIRTALRELEAEGKIEVIKGSANKIPYRYKISGDNGKVVIPPEKTQKIEVVEAKAKRKYQKNKQIQEAEIKEKIMEWIKVQGGQDFLSFGYVKSSGKDTVKKVKEFRKFLDCTDNRIIKRCRDELVSEGKLEKKDRRELGIGGYGAVYKVIENNKTENKARPDAKLVFEKLKLEREEKKLQARLREDWIDEAHEDFADYEYDKQFSESEDDLGFEYPVSDLPERPIPPLVKNSKREINNKCDRCGGNLYRDDVKSIDPINSLVFVCINCGSEVYKEKEVV